MLNHLIYYTNGDFYILWVVINSKTGLVLCCKIAPINLTNWYFLLCLGFKNTGFKFVGKLFVLILIQINKLSLPRLRVTRVTNSRSDVGLVYLKPDPDPSRLQPCGPQHVCAAGNWSFCLAPALVPPTILSIFLAAAIETIVPRQLVAAE